MYYKLLVRTSSVDMNELVNNYLLAGFELRGKTRHYVDVNHLVHFYQTVVFKGLTPPPGYR